MLRLHPFLALFLHSFIPLFLHSFIPRPSAALLYSFIPLSRDQVQRMYGAPCRRAQNLNSQISDPLGLFPPKKTAGRKFDYFSARTPDHARPRPGRSKRRGCEPSRCAGASRSQHAMHFPNLAGILPAAAASLLAGARCGQARCEHYSRPARGLPEPLCAARTMLCACRRQWTAW